MLKRNHKAKKQKFTLIIRTKPENFKIRMGTEYCKDQVLGTYTIICYHIVTVHSYVHTPSMGTTVHFLACEAVLQSTSHLHFYTTKFFNIKVLTCIYRH